MLRDKLLAVAVRVKSNIISRMLQIGAPFHLMNEVVCWDMEHDAATRVFVCNGISLMILPTAYLDN